MEWLTGMSPTVDGQCVFQITANGAAATAQWAVIFTAIAQVDEICLKQGKSGHAYHVGMYHSTGGYATTCYGNVTAFRKRSILERQHCAEA